jgi:hypothetical protein
MKTLHRLNCFFVGLPIALGLIGIIFNDLFFLALLSTMITGLGQLLLGLFLLIKEPKNKFLHFYFLGVFLFFGLCYFNDKFRLEDSISLILFSLPTFLVMYLTIIIYKKSKT